MNTWRLAESLKILRGQINAEFPTRSKASDGSIGDTAHSARKSDHNPNEEGVVCAVDITHDPKSGCTGDKLAAALIKSRDRRIKYLIWNRRMLSSYPANGKPAWTWRPYTGSNPHNHHIHISVGEDPTAYDSKAEWDLDLDLAVMRTNLAEASKMPADEPEPENPTPTPSDQEPAAAANKQAGSNALVAVEKPAPKGFISTISKKITAVCGGSLTLDAVTEKASQANALNLPGQFWKRVFFFAVAAAVVYLIYELVNFVMEQKREKEITNNLIQANTTATNKVVLVDKDKVAEFEKEGYQIIHR